MDIETLAKRAGMLTEIRSGAASCVWTDGLTAVSADQLNEFARLVASEEREACAKVCDGFASDGGPSGPYECAEAIRMRSNHQISGGDTPSAASPVEQNIG